MVLVLIFVYPIKLITQITVEYFSEILAWEFLSTGLFQSESWSSELVWVNFVYLAIGLFLLSVILTAFYQNSLRFSEELSITSEEARYCTNSSLIWGGSGCDGCFIFNHSECSIAGEDTVCRVYLFFFTFDNFSCP